MQHGKFPGSYGIFPVRRKAFIDDRLVSVVKKELMKGYLHRADTGTTPAKRGSKTKVIIVKETLVMW
jgi:hypothetical protein